MSHRPLNGEKGKNDRRNHEGNGETENEEPETEETEEAEENETLIRVTDENGIEYEIPKSVLAKYRVD